MLKSSTLGDAVGTEPGLKSATASNVTKPAKTGTGLVVQAPAYINEGEKTRVDTSEGACLSRASALQPLHLSADTASHPAPYTDCHV